MIFIPWRTIAYVMIPSGFVFGFILGWIYRGRVIAATILKHYYNQNYKKEDNVLYIDKFRGKIK